jgi:DNA-binding MarR family transcriptional regulator
MDDTSIQTLTNAMVSGGSALLREANRLFRPSGVTAAQFNALHLLDGNPDGLRPSDLTRLLVVDPSSITYLLDELEKRGWVCRKSDLADRRAYRVHLMPEGTGVHAKINSLYQACLTEVSREVDMRNSKPIAEFLLQIQKAAAVAVDRLVGRLAGGGKAGAGRPRSARRPSRRAGTTQRSS